MTSREEYNTLCDQLAEHMDASLPVSEVFGPTIQGEGPHAGRSSYFIRMGGCNLSCEWCDTPYSTGTHGIPLSTVPRRTVRSIAQAIPSGAMVVLTGGEPLMHVRKKAFQLLVYLLKAKGCEVHVETNGTLSPDILGGDIDHFTISPKIGVEMVNPRHENQTSLVGWVAYNDKSILKAVWCDDDADKFCERSIRLAEGIGIPKAQVWVMPEGTTLEALQERWADIAQAAANHGINATHRLHTLAWGNEKGH